VTTGKSRKPAGAAATTRSAPQPRRSGVNALFALIGPATSSGRVEDQFNDIERALDRLDPFFAECALSLRSMVDPVLRVTPTELLTTTLVADHQTLELYRSQYEAGDPQAILRAFAWALGRSLPPPAWAAAAFLERYRRYVDPAQGSPSLDDLFAAGQASGARARARQAHDWQLGAQLWCAVVESLHAGRAASLTAALRQVLAARKWGVAATKARALVEAVERVQRPVIGGKALADYGRQVISQKRPRARRA
jgi:hypothetical protein